MIRGDVIRELLAAGWVLNHVRGLHHAFNHPDRPGHVVVPHPKTDFGTGVVAAIRTQAGHMRYPIAIEPDTDTTAFGVIVPDLPGCFSARDTLDEAITEAEEAASAWVYASLDAADPIPCRPACKRSARTPATRDGFSALSPWPPRCSMTPPSA